ncbi:hypothetical protein WJX82_003908 [Trebouxia sp. C0006]
MSGDASGTVLLLRNAAAHAGQIKRELAAIIQSSGSVHREWVSQIRGLSDPAARDYRELQEPSVPDLSDVFGQGLGASARGEGVAPGEQQAPPKADDGHLDTPLPRSALSRGPQSYPIFSAMHSDDDASLSSQPSHNHIHKVHSMPLRTSQQQFQQQLQPIRTCSLASRQPFRGSPPPEQARASAPWQPWRMYQTRGGEMYAHPSARVGSAPPYPYPARTTDAGTPTDRSLSPDLSAMFDKGFLKTPRAAARSPRPKRRARPVQEPPAWDKSHKGAVVRGGAGLQRGDRGVNQQESLQELKQRFMARLQQANDGMYVNKIRRQQQAGSTAGAKRHSHSQENALMSSSRLAHMPTVEKRVPYQALLRRRPSSTSSSVPVTPLKTRPAWATVEPEPPSDTWQASMSLQNSPVKAVLPQHSQVEEEHWPDLSHLNWEGAATGVVSGRPDVFARVGASNQMGVQTRYPTGEAEMDVDAMGPIGNIAGRSKQGKMNSHFADQTLMKQSSLQQRPRWGSPNALPSRPHSRAGSSGQVGDPPAPLMSTFRLSDLTAHRDEQGSESRRDPGLHQQQEAHWQQAQHAQQGQPEEVQTQQAQHAQQRQKLDAQPSAQHSSTVSGSDEAASEQASDAHSVPASTSAVTSQTDTGGLQGRNEDGPAAGAEDTTAASSWPASTAAANDSDAENRSPPRPDSKAGTSQQDDSYTGAVASPHASSNGSPVTPAAAAAFSFRSTMGRLRGLDAAELQSPNRRKYVRSESRDPGVRIRDHPVGSVLLEAAPAVGTMTGADLLAALSKGSEMRKAWEGGLCNIRWTEYMYQSQHGALLKQ